MKSAKIVILAGQSNAVGVGHIKYLPRHFSEQRVERFMDGYSEIPINYYSHDMKSNGFVKTTVGCAEKSQKTFGPEIGIADSLSEKYPDKNIFIVKCAVGGTNLYHDWLSPSGEGDYNEASFGDGEDSDVTDVNYHGTGWCYNELVKILRESISELEKQGYQPEICAFCWMQGESDADIPEHVSAYPGRYGSLLKDLNSLFGEYTKKCIYIDAGISEIWHLYREINEIKRDYAEKNENRFFIDTIAEGLTTLKEPEPDADTAHYDSDCTIKLGNLFAEKIIL